MTLLKIIFLICGAIYGAGQFFLTSRFTKSLLAGKITDSVLPALAKLALYVGIFLFVWFYRDEGRIWGTCRIRCRNTRSGFDQFRYYNNKKRRW